MAEKLNVPKNCRANFRRLLQSMERNGEIQTAPQKPKPNKLNKLIYLSLPN